MNLVATSVAVYATENLTDSLWGELVPLLEQHYDEVAYHKDIPLDPDRAGYERIASCGALRIYTARVDGRLIGYMVCFVSRSLHYKSKIFANQDILFIDKLYRGTRIGVDMIRYGQQHLRSDDRVDLLFQHTKAKPELNIGKMLKRLLGYEIVDEIYAVRLDLEK